MPARIISVLGCGWLGFPLAGHLVERGYVVNGSTTHADRIFLLKESRINPFLIKFIPRLRKEKDVEAFFKANILFLNIPFERNLKDPYYYKKQIQSVISYVQESPIEFVVFASSTAVYPDSLADALEGVVFSPDSTRSRVLWEIEQLLLNNHHFKSTIIRFAGLYGPGRPIGRFISGKKDLFGAKAPVNLIHQDDCVRIITAVIKRDIRGEIFNAVSDVHPSREDLYTAQAIHLGLKPPEFVHEESSRVFKIVSNIKVKKILNYIFKYPDPSIPMDC